MALVNGSDTRLGLEEIRGAQSELVLAGFVRSIGWIGTFHLERVHDEEGEPQGYAVLAAVDLLNPNYQQAFATLTERFRFKDAHAALGGTSASNANEFLKQCVALGLVTKDGEGIPKGK